jgi:hypothetical protein
LSSVMICWSTVETALNISFIDELFTLGAWTDRSVKLLLGFVSTVIPGFNLLEIHNQDTHSLLDVNVFQNRPSCSTEEGSALLCRCHVFAPYIQHGYIRAVTASRSLWSLVILCQGPLLSDIYTWYTEVSAQWRLEQQVMP